MTDKDEIGKTKQQARELLKKLGFSEQEIEYKIEQTVDMSNTLLLGEQIKHYLIEKCPDMLQVVQAFVYILASQVKEGTTDAEIIQMGIQIAEKMQIWRKYFKWSEQKHIGKLISFNSYEELKEHEKQLKQQREERQKQPQQSKPSNANDSSPYQ